MTCTGSRTLHSHFGFHPFLYEAQSPPHSAHLPPLCPSHHLPTPSPSSHRGLPPAPRAPGAHCCLRAFAPASPCPEQSSSGVCMTPYLTFCWNLTSLLRPTLIPNLSLLSCPFPLLSCFPSPLFPQQDVWQPLDSPSPVSILALCPLSVTLGGNSAPSSISLPVKWKEGSFYLSGLGG